MVGWLTPWQSRSILAGVHVSVILVHQGGTKCGTSSSDSFYAA